MIADKAIVCFRCGTPTAVPPAETSQGRARPARRNWLLAVLPLVSGLGVMLLIDDTTEKVRGFLGGATVGAAVAAVQWWWARRAGRVR